MWSNYSLFHKTLPNSSLLMHWISVRFYKTCFSYSHLKKNALHFFRHTEDTEFYLINHHDQVTHIRIDLYGRGRLIIIKLKRPRLELLDSLLQENVIWWSYIEYNEIACIKKNRFALCILYSQNVAICYRVKTCFFGIIHCILWLKCCWCPTREARLAGLQGEEKKYNFSLYKSNIGAVENLLFCAG